MICGIEYLHKNHIVHRDLKPENLLLDKMKQNVKVVDFGLSNTYKTLKNGEMSLLRTACGSPCYAAPEMIAGRPYSGSCVDIWSSGVTLYAMVCGYLPFEETDIALLYGKILKGEFEIPSYLSIQVVELIKGLLTVDPSKRLTFEQIHKIAWFVQGSVSVTSKIPPKPFTKSMIQSHGFDLTHV